MDDSREVAEVREWLRGRPAVELWGLTPATRVRYLLELVDQRDDLLTLIWQRLVERRPELYKKHTEGCGVLDIVRDVINQAQRDFNAGARPIR